MIGPRILPGLAISLAILAQAGPAGASVLSTAPDNAAAPGSGRVYYVSPNGSDSNDGRSFASPWQTINYAVDARSGSPVAAGDTVIVLPGTYTEQISFSRSGRPGDSITLKSLFPSAALLRPTLRAYSTVDLIGSYLSIVGFDVQGGSGHAIDGGHTPNGRAIRNHHILIANNYVHDSGGGGIEVAWGDYYTIEGNLSERNCATNPWHTSGISIYQPHAVDAEPGFHNFVRFNVSRLNSEGPAIRGHTDGNGIIIDDGNNTQAGPGQSLPYGYATLVEGNLVYGNGGKGLQIAWSNYVTARDNTFYKNNRDNAISGTWRAELSNNFSSFNTLSNNIMVADPAINPNNTAIGDQTLPAKWPTAGGKWVANLTFDGTPGSPSIAVNGTKPIFIATLAGQDPKFIAPSLDPARANFGLDSTSPVLEAGSRPATGQ
jgi:hypothetical protein